MGAVEDVRKVSQDSVAPDLRALTVRLDVLEKRIDERFGGVERRIDGAEKHLDKRIDGVEKRLETRIGGLERNVDVRFDAVDLQFKVLAATLKDNQAQMMSQLSTSPKSATHERTAA